MRRTILFLVLLVPFCVKAQSPAFFRYTKESGLTCEEIYDLHQDRLGFMWVASDRGVFRFDGYNFQRFTTAQGLTNNTVFHLYEDYRGRMWMMSFSGDLCYIENDRVVEYEFNDVIEKYAPGLRMVRSIEVDETGTVQIGFLLQGLIEISPDGKLRRIKLNGPDVSRLFWAFETASKRLLLGVQENLSTPGTGALLIKTTNQSTTVLLPDIPVRTHLAGVLRSNGSQIVGIGKTLYEMNGDGQIHETEIPAVALCLLEDSNGCLWIGTDGKGILKYESGKSPLGNAYENYYPEEIITCIEEDAEGAFWVSTHHNGLLYLPNIAVRAWSCFANDEANSLLPDDSGKMYVLWRDHGLTSITKNTITEYPFARPGLYFRTLCWNFDRTELLIGTTESAVSVDPVSGAYNHIFNRGVNSIACCKDNTYFGQAWNLYCTNSNNATSIIGNPLVRHRPDVLLTDVSGNVWVGTLDGLYCVTDTALESHAARHDLFTRRVAAMCELPDSTLVVATQSNGIAFMRGEYIRTLTQSDQFPCDHIYGITVGKNGLLWCSTQDGLFEINAVDSAISFREFPALKTVLGHGGKPCYQPSTGLLWICDGNRVVAFNPELASREKSVPPVYISYIEVGDSLYGASDTLELPYDENALRISYCGIAYRMQGAITYRYRLKGSSDAWETTTQNTLEFAALEPGAYLFEVMAQNENGTWSARPATFSFVIIPPFWGTWWFIAGVVVIGGLWMYLIIVLRFRMIRRRDLLREQALIFRQQALASQMNPHFVFNTLNTIQAFVLKEEKTKALDMFSSFASLLRKSLEHSTERFIPLSEELRMLKLYFELEEMRFEGNLKYKFEFGPGVVPDQLKIPAMLIQPMAENALVHGIRRKEGGGTVEIRFIFRGNQLICEVDDNGIGRSAAAQQKKSSSSAGTRITRDRLRVLGQLNGEQYEFNIIDKTDTTTGAATGTLVRFALPYTLNKPSNNEETDRFTG